MRKGSKQGARIDGQAVQRMDKTLAEAAEEFLKIKEATGRAEQTLKTYRYQLRYFLDYAGQGVKCSDLTLELLTEYLDHLRARGITNSTTLNTAIQNLSPIIHYARERGYCPHQYLMPFIRGQELDKQKCSLFTIFSTYKLQYFCLPFVFIIIPYFLTNGQTFDTICPCPLCRLRAEILERIRKISGL